jgi:hypothetical protein
MRGKRTRRQLVRTSVDPLRDRALSLIDGAKDHAEETVKATEQRVLDVIGAGADGATSRVERAADRVPTVAVTSTRSALVRRLRLGLLVLAALVGLWAWRRYRQGAGSSADEGRDATAVDDEGFRVVPKADGGWGLRGPRHPETEHRTQALAIEEAKTLAQAAGGGQIIVHGLDGEPRETVRV